MLTYACIQRMPTQAGSECAVPPEPLHTLDMSIRMHTLDMSIRMLAYAHIQRMLVQNVLFLVSLVLVVFFFKANLKRTDRAKARQAAGAPCAISHTPPITP